MFWRRPFFGFPFFFGWPFLPPWFWWFRPPFHRRWW